MICVRRRGGRKTAGRRGVCWRSPWCSTARAEGRRPRLSPEQRGELAQLVEDGPDVAEHGVVRWRCQDLKVVIRRRFGVELAERQIERILKQLKFARISVRPRHPKADEATQQAFKKTSAPW